MTHVASIFSASFGVHAILQMMTALQQMALSQLTMTAMMGTLTWMQFRLAQWSYFVADIVQQIA